MSTFISDPGADVTLGICVDSPRPEEYPDPTPRQPPSTSQTLSGYTDDTTTKGEEPGVQVWRRRDVVLSGSAGRTFSRGHSTVVFEGRHSSDTH